MIYVKRAYEKPEEADGYRLLVDRLWPRGVSKELADIDFWLKEIAPSNELRQWFNHDLEKFPEFKERYRKELEGETEAVQKLTYIIKEEPTVTFIYSAKNQTMNNAVVLKEIMEQANEKNGQKGKIR